MVTLTNNEKAKAIVQAIIKEEKRIREKYPIFAHQNILGFVILLVSLSTFIGVATLYYFDVLPAWVAVILLALAASISHELEHDLIHRQYFSKHPFMYNMMMLMVWLMRPNTVNPWYRRDIHLNHHRVSGTEQDLEERLVGNGIKSHWLRLIVICDGLMGLVINRTRLKKEVNDFSFLRVINAGFPIITAYYALFYTWIIYNAVNYFSGNSVVYPEIVLSVMPFINFMIVVWVLPNFIRSVSLNFITSSMHYYGGVNHLLQQTQVINHWMFVPFQLFCFNFGNTHSIHHFVPNQPFYLRQMVSKKVHEIMKKHGVPFNDLQSILRANLYVK